MSWCWASIGSGSQSWMPGTFVSITPNSPRISTGASGLGSKLSMWLMPALEPEQDARDVLPGRRRRGPRPQEIGQAQAQRRERSDPEEIRRVTPSQLRFDRRSSWNIEAPSLSVHGHGRAGIEQLALKKSLTWRALPPQALAVRSEVFLTVTDFGVCSPKGPEQTTPESTRHLRRSRATGGRVGFAGGGREESRVVLDGNGGGLPAPGSVAIRKVRGEGAGDPSSPRRTSQPPNEPAAPNEPTAPNEPSRAERTHRAERSHAPNESDVP